jgi:putative hydrolase of the HAD superfamily
MPVRALLFDVGDTLWHAPAPPPPAAFRQLAAERAAATFARLGVDADPALAARVAWDALEASMVAARQSGLQEPDYASAASAALAEHGIVMPLAAAAAFLDDIYVSGAEGGKEAFPEARETLLALKERGFLLATVTNRAFGGNRYRCDLRACGLDVGWDAHAVSVEVGFLKPHRAPFEAALAALGVRPPDAVMVGNSLLEDIAGAHQLGIRAAWRRCPPDAEGIVPDWTFDSLEELLAIPDLARGR